MKYFFFLLKDVIFFYGHRYTNIVHTVVLVVENVFGSSVKMDKKLRKEKQKIREAEKMVRKHDNITML